MRLNDCGYHGVLLFLFLLALAMVRLFAAFVLIPLILTLLANILPIPRRAAGYLAVARTVCKNE